MLAFFNTLLREPLFQFLILGALIFAVDRYALGNRDDPRLIQVDDQKYQELQQLFVEGQGREPSPTEMKKLIIKWAENEIMFREAIRLGLDQGDDMIRNRVILKMRNVLFNNAIMDNPSDNELQAFFDFKRGQYDTPERLDIEQFPVASLNTIAEAQALAEQLNDAGAVPPRYENNLRRYPLRPIQQLQTLFGEDGQQRLSAADVGQWVAFEQAGRLRLARIVNRYPAQAAQLADVKSRVTQDWLKFSYEIQLADQAKAIADQYAVKMALSPALADQVRLSIKPDELHPESVTGNHAAVQAAMN